MSTKKKPTAPGAEPASGALRHSPFAALAGRVAPPPDGASEPSPPVPEAPPAPPAPSALSGKITVRRETGGRGGKTVTRILGLPAARLDELAGRMKKALGCGAVVEGADLVLLGSLVPRAAAWLRAEGASRVVEGN